MARPSPPAATAGGKAGRWRATSGHGGRPPRSRRRTSRIAPRSSLWLFDLDIPAPLHRARRPTVASMAALAAAASCRAGGLQRYASHECGAGRRIRQRRALQRRLPRHVWLAADQTRRMARPVAEDQRLVLRDSQDAPVAPPAFFLARSVNERYDCSICIPEASVACSGRAASTSLSMKIGYSASNSAASDGTFAEQCSAMGWVRPKHPLATWTSLCG